MKRRSSLPLLALTLVLFAACARPDLPASVVRAASEEELTLFRVELADRFGAAQLAAYDTALQELQLAGMETHPTAAARAAAMRAQVDGRTVREVEILGWQARHHRQLGEIKLFEDMLAHDSALRDKSAATGTPQAVLDRINSETDMIAKLRRLLGETEQQLAAWGAAPGGPH